MKKNIIILNRVDIDESPYHDWLDSEKYNIYLITDIGKFKKASDTKCKYAEIHEFDNYMLNANVELFAVTLAKKINIHAVVAYSEVDIIRAARIREALDLPGQNIENGFLYRDKLKMRELSLDKGFKTPNFLAVESIQGLAQFITENDYPFIIKPRFGMATIGVKKINNRIELSKFLETHLYSAPDIIQPFIAESFIAGDVYSIDILVSNNKIIVAEPLLYINTCLNYASNEVKSVAMSQVSKNDPIYHRLIEFSNQLINQFPQPGYGGFHIEVFIDDDANITLCEIACRNGGGKIPQLFEKIHGVNPDAISVRLQASLGEDITWINNEIKENHQGALGFIFLSPENKTSNWQLPESTPFDFITEYEPNFEALHTIENVANFAAIATVYGNTITEMRNNIEHFSQWFYEPSA